MNNQTLTAPALSSRFVRNLPQNFVIGEEAFAQLLLREYGAIFVARGGATPPPSVIFRSDKEVKEFQNSIPFKTENIGGLPITLQRPAMEELIAAIEHVRGTGLEITPRGADSGSRSYSETVALWESRVEPALDHWTAVGRIDRNQSAEIRKLSAFEQVPVVLQLEGKGIYFAKDLSKSIIYSVAPPGTSQHLAMLAFDVSEFDDPATRAILANHGWYQTVTSDLPHFTFLGVEEATLPSLGLRRVENAGRHFWVPSTEDAVNTWQI